MRPGRALLFLLLIVVILGPFRTYSALAQTDLLPPTTWRALLIIFASIDVDYMENGVSKHFTRTLSQHEIDKAIWAFENFPVIADDFSEGEVVVPYDIVYSQRPLTTLTQVSGWYWPSPTDTKPELQSYAPLGKYDSILVLWPQNYAGQSIPTGGWGLGMAPTSGANGSTYATVTNAPDWMWEVPTVGEIWLHEWLHGVSAFYAAKGYAMPRGDADGGSSHGYPHSPTLGWSAYYRDLMTGRVLEDGVYKGITAAAWRSGSITDKRGKIAFTCDIRGRKDDEQVACALTLDAVPQPEIPAGQQVTIDLRTGDHTLDVRLTGEHAARWTPSSAQQTVKVNANRATNVAMRFDKLGRALVSLNQPGVIGDFWVDGQLAVSQAASADLWLMPNKSHTIKVTNLSDPAANGVYRWRDTSTTVSLAPGQEKTIQLALTKQYLKGFLSLTCTIHNAAPGQANAGAVCIPQIDGVLSAPVPAGSTAQIPLDPGRHKLVVILGPEGIWKPASVSQTIYIQAGSTYRFRASFFPQRLPAPTPTLIPTPTPTPTPAP